MKLFSYIFIFSLSVSSYAQRLEPITFDNNRIALKQNKNLFTERLHLPFFDDFSLKLNSPDTLLWEKNGGVYVNDNFGWQPPSFGVATFDGVNSSGEPYNVFDPSALGKTDELVSNKIDLSAAPQKVYLSFYVQPSGLGFVQPNPGDSLKVFLLDSSFSWKQVWSMYIDSVQDFKFVSIPVLESKYLFKDFQFKFEAYGNKSGMYDVWNIDYVYLDKNRDTSSFMRDIAISQSPNSFLKQYTAMPYDQFLVNTTASVSDSMQISINDFKNNGGLPIPFNKKCILTETISNISNTIFDNGAIINNLEKQFIISSGNNTLDLFSDNNEMSIETMFEINTNDPEKGDTILKVIPDTIITDKGTILIGVGDAVIYKNIYYIVVQGLNLTFQMGDTFYFQNDTLIILNTITLNPIGRIEPITTNHNNKITRTCVLKDYFAYDDGSAEKTFVMTQKYGFVAYRFNLNMEDTLVGIEFCAPKTAKSVDGESIDLVVWQDLDVPTGMGDSILHSEPIAVYLSDSLNAFKTIRYEKAIPVKDHFYIGWLVTGDEEVHFGYDVNNSANGKIWVKKEDEWSLFDDHGALMIRPILGNERFLGVSNKKDATYVEIYPNPTSGIVSIVGLYDELKIFNQLGELIENRFNEKVIDLSFYQNGVYFMQIIIGDSVQFKKIILAK